MSTIFITPFWIALLAEGVSSRWFPWWVNYPGFEVWKFFNLFLFVGVLVYFLRRPLGTAMRARRAGIRLDLNRAREERDAALSKLKEVEFRLGALDNEVAMLRQQTQREAAEERARIASSGEEESRKFHEQARREIESASKAARQELRRYAAEQTVQLARQIISKDIGEEDDSRLYDRQIQEFGGLRH